MQNLSTFGGLRSWRGELGTLRMHRVMYLFLSLLFLLATPMTARAAGLTFVGAQSDGVGGVDSLASPGQLAVSRDGLHVYVPATDDDAITVFSRNADRTDPDFGKLTFVQDLANINVGNLDAPVAVALSPDGLHVYVVSNASNAIVIFNRDPATGKLTFASSIADGCAEGKVGSCTIDSQCDTESGLGDGRCVDDGIDAPTSVAVSADGANVYVTSSGDDALAVFDRDAVSGALTFVESQRDNAGVVDGLGGASAIGISANGGHVYVAGPDDDAVAVFSRDGDTGALTFVEATDLAVGDPRSVSLSPNGTHLYAASKGGDAVVIFDRNSTTGVLSAPDVVANDTCSSGKVGGTCTVDAECDTALGTGDGICIDGLNGARSVLVSPDGTHVYVAGANDNAVAVFTRDSTTGDLKFFEAQRAGVCAAGKVGDTCSTDDECDTTVGAGDGTCTAGLKGVAFLATSPLPGNHLYVASSAGVSPDDAVAAFRIHLCGDTFVDDAEDIEECDDGNTDDGDCCSATCQFDADGTACTDDGDVCTDDVCDGQGKCLNKPNTEPCDDGIFCNGADLCKEIDGEAGCNFHRGDPCTEHSECNDVCDEDEDTCADPAGTSCSSDDNECTDDQCDGNGSCAHLNNTLECEDDNLPCTDDICTEGSCTHPFNSAPCDNGVFCDGSDTCQGGGCALHAGDPCDESSQCNGVCNEDEHTCADPAGTPCDDALFCNGDDQCSGGTCSFHSGDPCAGGSECTSICAEDLGACVVPSGISCTDDDNPCTTDLCRDGACAHEAISGCEVCVSDIDCDDANPCSNDTCGATGCEHAAIPGCGFCVDDGDCNDGNLCTDDFCDDSTCAHAAIPGCLSCASDSDCNDTDSCTLDSCGLDDQCVNNLVVPATGCFSALACPFFDGLSSASCTGERIPGVIKRLVDRAGCKVQQAEDRARDGRPRVQKKLRIGMRSLQRAAKKVNRARGKKISSPCGASLAADIADRLGRISTLLDQTNGGSLLASCTEAMQIPGGVPQQVAGPSLCSKR